MFNFSVGDIISVFGRQDSIKFDGETGTVVLVAKDYIGVIFDNKSEYYHKLVVYKDSVKELKHELFMDYHYDKQFIELIEDKGYMLYFDNSHIKINLHSNPYDPSQQPVDDEDI